MLAGCLVLKWLVWCEVNANCAGTKKAAVEKTGRCLVGFKGAGRKHPGLKGDGLFKQQLHPLMASKEWCHNCMLCVGSVTGIYVYVCSL